MDDFISCCLGYSCLILVVVLQVAFAVAVFAGLLPSQPPILGQLAVGIAYVYGQLALYAIWKGLICAFFGTRRGCSRAADFMSDATWRFQEMLRTPARRRAEERRTRLRERFPIPGKWPDRGWLVMLRARDRRALAQSTRWLAPLERMCCRHRRERTTLRSRVVFGAAVAGDGGGDELATADAADIEWCEEGRPTLDFTKTVVTVVEIEEEGLFRNIVTFL